MNKQIDQFGSPGLAISWFFKNTTHSTLCKLVGPSTIEMIQALDPNLLKENNFGQFAIQLIDPSEVLRDEGKRNLILNEIPYSKLQELANRLGMQSKKVEISEVCARATDKNVIPIIFSFFGIVSEERAAKSKSSDKEKVETCYPLYKHQRDVAKRVEKFLNEYPNKVVLHMPTGAGKTRTTMHIVATHLRNNENSVVVWLAQNAELLDQAADEFEIAWKFLGNRDIDIIRFWGNRSPNFENVHDGIIVAGLSKMSAFDKKHGSMMVRLGDRASLTIIDEAHQAIAPTYASVLDTLYSKRPNNKLLGLTATPGRSWQNIEEDKALAEFFDNRKVTLEIEGYTDPIKFLITEKYLARPKFKQLNVNSSLNLSDSETNCLETNSDIPDSVLKRLGSEIERNRQIIVAIEDLLKRHTRIIVFAPSVECARLLKILLTGKQHEAELVLGESNKMHRERIIRRFKSNDAKPIILVNFGVLTTGFDAPNVSAAVIARPTSSLVLYWQMVGRATRGTRAGGNNEAEIVTIIDTELQGFGCMEESFNFWDSVWKG